MAKNFPKLMVDTKLQIQEVQKTEQDRYQTAHPDMSLSYCQTPKSEGEEIHF